MESAIRDRRQRFAGLLSGDGPVVLVGAGEPIGKPGGQDQTYPFIPHPEYYWLTGSRRSGCVLAYEPATGWTHFVRPAGAVERLWEGDPQVPEGEDVGGLENWLRARSQRPVAVLGGSAGIPTEAFRRDPALDASVREKMDRVRRRKDEVELALVDRAASATGAGFAKAREVIRPGATEREVQIEMEAEMLRHGATGTGFGTIVAAGAHAAVLHFEPGDRVVGEEDVVLVDSGADVHGYCADVTRTYPAAGRFKPEQQDIYDLVLAVQLGAIDRCRAGIEWHEVHTAAAGTFGQGLKDLGILRGSLDDLVEGGAVSLFFPHGIGHMVGLGVRDVGGTAQGRPDGRLFCGVKLRVDLPLEPGFLMTVEPGLYFVPAILDDVERRSRFKNAVAWDALGRWRAVGGVRIEDDVLITSGAPRVMTSAIPK